MALAHEKISKKVVSESKSCEKENKKFFNKNEKVPTKPAAATGRNPRRWPTLKINKFFIIRII